VFDPKSYDVGLRRIVQKESPTVHPQRALTN
jgi:hypothetical protein